MQMQRVVGGVVGLVALVVLGVPARVCAEQLLKETYAKAPDGDVKVVREVLVDNEDLQTQRQALLDRLKEIDAWMVRERAEAQAKLDTIDAMLAAP